MLAQSARVCLSFSGVWSFSVGLCVHVAFLAPDFFFFCVCVRARCMIFVPVYRCTYRRWSRGRPLGPEALRNASGIWEALRVSCFPAVWETLLLDARSTCGFLSFLARYRGTAFFLRQNTHLCQDVLIFPTFWCGCICVFFLLLKRVFERRDEIRYDFQYLCDVGIKNASILGVKRTGR